MRLQPGKMKKFAIYVLLLNNNYNRHPNLRKLFCSLVECVPIYFLKLSDILVDDDRNRYMTLLTNLISNFLNSPETSLKLSAIRATMSFLSEYHKLVVIDRNKDEDEFGSLAMIAVRALVNIAMNGAADDHHELCAILKNMEDTPAQFLSRSVARTGEVMSCVSYISKLPNLLEIARKQSIRFFVRMTAEFSSQPQAGNAYVHRQIADFIVFLINLMSHREGEPEWDPEAIDDEDEQKGMEVVQGNAAEEDEQMGDEADREDIPAVPALDQPLVLDKVGSECGLYFPPLHKPFKEEEQRMGEDDPVDIPSYLFAYNQLERITSNIGSEWIFTDISAQIKKGPPSEIYAWFLASNLLTRGFTLKDSLDSSAQESITLAMSHIASTDHRLAWSAATLIWEVGIKLQELESDYLSSLRSYVQKFLEPSSTSHNSTRVRARMLKALEAFS